MPLNPLLFDETVRVDDPDFIIVPVPLTRPAMVSAAFTRYSSVPPFNTVLPEKYLFAAESFMKSNEPAEIFVVPVNALLSPVIVKVPVPYLLNVPFCASFDERV